jgi:hypothetical protein
MRYEPKFRDTGVKELETIVAKYYYYYSKNKKKKFYLIYSSSFMIITHPNSGVNPVLIYERKGPGIYTAKASVIIVSLLHDFMETHSNMIELYDIGE